jgi:flavorubredoxin
MSEPFAATKVTDRVYWVGAIDWALRDFHGYSTERGTTYNAFLILADKVTLVDTVRAPFREEMMSRIASIIDPAKIDYVISNHSEMDHSGCLPYVIERIKPEKVFASENGAKALDAHFHRDLGVTVVADGQTVSLGGVQATFIETRMLHWPDSMFTYLPEDRILFSQDGFGMHLASSQRFDDEIDDGILEYEAAKYYANILLPFSAAAKVALDKASKLDIVMIAPDHGPIWRTGVKRIVDLYARWNAHKPANKALLIYDTMWGSTEAMAKAIEDGIVGEGVQARSMRLRENHRSNVATEYLDAGAIIVGSPTLNGGMFPTVAENLSYLKGLKRKNLIGAVFGSYGWSGDAVAQIKEILASMRVELVTEPLNIMYVPEKPGLLKCRKLGTLIARKLKERVAGPR